MDGQFGLVRRKASGHSERQAFHANHYFLSQEEVDASAQRDMPMKDLERVTPYGLIDACNCWVSHQGRK